MKLRLPTLKSGINELADSINPAELDLDSDIFRVPVIVDGTVDLDESKLDVRLHVETEGHYVCDRCAVEFDRPFSVDLRVLVLRRDPHDADEEEAVDLLFIGTGGQMVDLSEEIADALLLDVPLQILHDSECKGLCPVCYQDWNEGTCEHYSQYSSGSSDNGSSGDEPND